MDAYIRRKSCGVRHCWKRHVSHEFKQTRTCGTAFPPIAEPTRALPPYAKHTVPCVRYASLMRVRGDALRKASCSLHDWCTVRVSFCMKPELGRTWPCEPLKCSLREWWTCICLSSQVCVCVCVCLFVCLFVRNMYGGVACEPNNKMHL